LKSITAIYDLLEDEHDERMLHRIPAAESVTRHTYLAEACKGKTILDIGGSGPLRKLLLGVAKKYYSLDKTDADFCVNLDRDPIPFVEDVELIICGEVVEHLSNPGFFLDGLRRYTVPVIFTVPNAFAKAGRQWVEKGIECVNLDHVAYYSYYTFSNLIRRHGFTVEKFLWYNGRPGLSEGMIFTAR